jgi:hypothetical protein
LWQVGSGRGDARGRSIDTPHRRFVAVQAPVPLQAVDSIDFATFWLICFESNNQMELNQASNW